MSYIMFFRLSGFCAIRPWSHTKAGDPGLASRSSGVVSFWPAIEIRPLPFPLGRKRGIIFSKSPHAQNVFIQGGSAEGRWRTNKKKRLGRPHLSSRGAQRRGDLHDRARRYGGSTRLCALRDDKGRQRFGPATLRFSSRKGRPPAGVELGRDRRPSDRSACMRAFCHRHIHAVAGSAATKRSPRFRSLPSQTMAETAPADGVGSSVRPRRPMRSGRRELPGEKWNGGTD
jgi:hypothetical protein